MSLDNYLVRFSQTTKFILALFSFFWGLAVANYLIGTPNWGAVPLIVGYLFILISAAGWLDVYFERVGNMVYEISHADWAALKPYMLNRALSGLFGISVLFLLLINTLNTMLLVYFAITIALILAASVPPFSLSKRGFGDLVYAVVLGHFIPALAFLTQQDSLHRMLPLLSLPVTFMFLAFFISQNFEHFARDQKYSRQTSLTCMGWQNSILLLNAFLLIPYFLLAFSGLLGIPFRLIWPALLTLPLAIYQIYMFWRIAEGANPSWIMIRWVGLAIVVITLYLMTYTLLIN